MTARADQWAEHVELLIQITHHRAAVALMAATRMGQ